ncbi:MAG: ribonuclease E/G [Alphaproteobacteria bacterium]|jgi:ribonuclease G|nr:ribonuclease E/G [Alphaproteobacteria bacterium]
MNNTKLIINSSSFYLSVFSIKNNILQNIFYQNQNSPKVNSIYLARVDKVMESLGGSFVNLGGKQEAFLKFNKNQNKPKIGEKILVQVVKTETIPNKKAVVSQDITLRGALLVLKPLSKNIIFSKKLTDDDKQKIVASIGNSLGFIIRSLYKHNYLEDLKTESYRLKNLWENIKSQKEVGLVYEASLLENIILDYAKNSSVEIIADTIEQHKQVQNVLNNYKFLEVNSKVYTEKEDILDFYDIRESLMDIQSTNLQLGDSFNLVFFESDSFNYIDVNFAGEISFNSKEEVAYKTNMEILPIAVNQILLRNLSGQILIDVLKITNKQYRNNLLDRCKKLLSTDENKATVLGFSNLGLLEISRQKTQDSFKLISKSLDYQLHLLIIKLRSLVASNSEKLTIVASSKHLDKLKTVANKELSELNIYINYEINESCKIPELRLGEI